MPNLVNSEDDNYDDFDKFLDHEKSLKYVENVIFQINDIGNYEM